jgi:hypothetical protein
LGNLYDHPVMLFGEEAEEAADADLLGTVDFGAGAKLEAYLVHQGLDVGTLIGLELG